MMKTGQKTIRVGLRTSLPFKAKAQSSAKPSAMPVVASKSAIRAAHAQGSQEIARLTEFALQTFTDLFPDLGDEIRAAVALECGDGLPAVAEVASSSAVAAEVAAPVASRKRGRPIEITTKQQQPVVLGKPLKIQKHQGDVPLSLSHLLSHDNSDHSDMQLDISPLSIRSANSEVSSLKGDDTPSPQSKPSSVRTDRHARSSSDGKGHSHHASVSVTSWGRRV